MIQTLYPVGSIYFTSNENNPGETGGVFSDTGTTWVSWGAGRVPIGIGTYTDVNGTEATIEIDQGISTPEHDPALKISYMVNDELKNITGEYLHQLSVDELPGHRHSFISGGVTVDQGSKYNRPVNVDQNGGNAKWSESHTYQSSIRG